MMTLNNDLNVWLLYDSDQQESQPVLILALKICAKSCWKTSVFLGFVKSKKHRAKSRAQRAKKRLSNFPILNNKLSLLSPINEFYKRSYRKISFLFQLAKANCNQANKKKNRHL